MRGFFVSFAMATASPSPREFASHLQEKRGGVLTVGVHKGTLFDEVLREHPDYCSWAAELSDPGKCLKDFAEYLTHCRAEAPTQPVNKRQRCTDDDPRDFLSGASCCICWDRVINAAFLPCGHAVSCLQCAQRVQKQGCPVCRGGVADVLRIYGV